MRFPKRLFYKDCPECTLRHHVGYDKPDGGYNMLFSMNYVNDFHRAVAQRIVLLWNTAQPQENKERSENSPASPVQLRKAEIELLLKGAIGRIDERNVESARRCITDALARLSAVA